MSDAKAPSYIWLVFSLALTGFALDQVSKYGLFHVLYVEPTENEPGAGRFPLIPGAFELYVAHGKLEDGTIVPHLNKGALFGLGQGANTLFAIISVVAAVAIIYWCTRRQTRGDGLLCTSLGLILAGTLGNLYDRVVFGGVRDFFRWYLWYEWPIFNVADSCLVCGAGLLLMHAFFTEPVRQPQPSDPAWDTPSQPVA
jgi:lipoprotein signal peptidase